MRGNGANRVIRSNTCFLTALVLLAVSPLAIAQRPGAETLARLESSLRPLAEKPRNDDWRRGHPEEKGQTFAEYLREDPVRRSRTLTTIYLCLLGDFTREQTKILEATSEYLSVVFDVPVKVRKRLPLDSIPARARREHPRSKVPQVLSTYVLDEVLKPDRPDDALAYLCFTASDLWPNGTLEESSLGTARSHLNQLTRTLGERFRI